MYEGGVYGLSIGLTPGADIPRRPAPPRIRYPRARADNHYIFILEGWYGSGQEGYDAALSACLSGFDNGPDSVNECGRIDPLYQLNDPMCDNGVSRFQYWYAVTNLYDPVNFRATHHLYLHCQDAPACPVKPLAPLPDEPCTLSIEDGKGLDIHQACPTTAIMTDPNGEPCLRRKLQSLDVTYTLTGSIRTSAYQNHLAEIWEKSQILENDLTPEQQQACAAKGITQQINAEKDAHGLISEPPPFDSNDSHVNGNTVDISRSTVTQAGQNLPLLYRVCNALGCKLSLQDYLDSAILGGPACSLIWGKYFKSIDEVHFQLRQ